MATETNELNLSEVNIEDVGAATKKIVVEISADEIDSKIEDSMDTLASSAALPGFRPGKIPRKLLERRYGKGLKDETRNEIVRGAFLKVVEDNKLEVIGEPILKDEEDVKIEPGTPLTLTFEVEVMPEFEMPTVEAIPIKRPVLEATDEMVDREIAAQQKRFGDLEDIEGDPQPGTIFTGQLVLYDPAGVKVAELPQHATRWPDPAEEDPDTDTISSVDDEDNDRDKPDPETGALGGFQIEKLGTHLEGKKPGDVVVIETEGPENHEVEMIRGEKVKIEFTIDRVANLIPTTTEDLLDKFVLESEDQLREQIMLAINQKIQHEQHEVMRAQIVKFLLAEIEFDIPERVSATQTARMVENVRLRLLSRGVPEVKIEEQMAEVRSASAQKAAHDLKVELILEKLADQLDVEVTEGEINGRIAMIARQQGERPEKVRQELIKSRRAAALVGQLRREKAVDMLVQKAEVSDISAEEWNATMRPSKSGTGDEAKPAAKKKTTTKKKTSKKKKKTTRKAAADKGDTADEEKGDG
jgi:trigger factor